jgi:hypothetical protein
MAQKDITIRLRTVETQLNQSLRKIEKLEKTVKRLSQKKVKLDTSAAEQAAKRLRQEIEKGNKIVDKLFNPFRTDGFGKSIAKVNSQLSLVTKSFNAATSAAERQRSATALIAGNFKKMRMEATAFAQASGNAQALRGAAGSVGNRLKEIKEFPKTILAGNKAMNILNGMLELAEENSKDFLDISKAIGEQLEKNKKIQASADKASGVSKKKNDIKNDQENLRKTERTAQRIKAIKEQTANIERRILDSSLNKFAKEKLITNLKRSGLELDRKELELAKQINIETQRNLTMEEKKQRRRGRIAQSTLIGGGFPLLFGGGPVQAIGGALGGGIGEAISPGGGFAGSIAATAFVSSIQKFGDSAREVGNALKDANLGLEKLEELGYKVDDSTKQQVESLLEVGKIREAEAIVLEKFSEIAGPKAIENLQNLDTEFDELQKATSKLFLTLASELAPALTAIIGLVTKIVDAATGPAIQRAAANLDPKAFRAAQQEANRRASEGFIIGGDRQKREQILTELSKDILRKFTPDLTTGLTKGGDGTSGGSGGRKDFSEFELNILNKRIELQKLSGNLLDEEVVKLKRGIIHAEAAMKFAQADGDIGKNKIINAEKLLKINELDKAVEEAKLKDKKELAKFLEDLRKQEQKEQERQDKLRQAEVERIDKIKKSANSVTENLRLQNELTKIKLTGSEYEIALAEATLGFTKEKLALFDEEAFKIQFNNKLQLDALTEQQRLVKEIKHTFAVEMSNAIKGLITGTMTLNQALSNVLNKMADTFLNLGLFGNLTGNLEKGKGLFGKIFDGLLADGGPAKAGRSYIVGERGPEVFTPGRSGMVTPNHALGGSTNVNVNVDASGSSVEGDGTQAEQLGEAISQAIQAELIQQKRPGGILYS